MSAHRAGFTLLTVLWLVTLLTALGLGAAARLGTGTTTSRNRMLLRRAEWARDACEALLQGDSIDRAAAESIRPVDLGDGLWCHARRDVPDARLDINLASRDELLAVLVSDSLVDALLDWRDADDDQLSNGAEADWYRARGRRPPRNGPLADVDELRLVRGFTDITLASVASHLTVHGSGKLDLAEMPRDLLRVLPGFTPELFGAVIGARTAPHAPASVEEWYAGLPRSLQSRSGVAQRELLRKAEWGSSRREFLVSGGGVPPIVAESRLLAELRGGIPQIQARLSQ